LDDELVAKLRVEETRLKKCAPPYSASSASAEPNARAIEVDAILRREGFVLLDGREGRGIASELAAMGTERHPGGVAWIFLRGSTTKDACADIVDAFELPCSASPRMPFVGKDGAFSTIWRGLSARPRALIVLDGWNDWSTEADWRRADCADVIAIPNEPLEPLRGDETAPAIDPAERRLLSILRILDQSIVPKILLERIVDAIPVVDGEAPLRASSLEGLLASMRERGLLARTLQGEARVAGSTRVACYAWLTPHVPDIEAAAAVLEKLLAATPGDCVHVLRRLGMHAWHLLADAEAFGAKGASVEALIKTLCTREYRLLYADVAKYWLVRVRSEEPEPGARTLDALMLLAGCLRDRRDLVEAQEVLREALPLAEKLHGESSMRLLPIIGLLNNVIGLGICGDATDEQLALAERELAICEKHCPTAPGLAYMYWGYGLKLAVREENERALPQFERAVAIAVPEDPFRSDYVLAVASALSDLGKAEEGFEHVDKALAMVRDGDPSRASSPLGVAREILRKHPHLLSRFHDLVTDVLNWPQWTKAEAESADLARVRTYMVFALSSQGRRSEAAPLAEKAIAVLEPLHGSDSRWVKELRAILE
jgi:tetratricopeptide (TPR) repeat protein